MGMSDDLAGFVKAVGEAVTDVCDGAIKVRILILKNTVLLRRRRWQSILLRSLRIWISRCRKE